MKYFHYYYLFFGRNILLLLCNAGTSNIFKLGSVDEMNLDDINILYNIKILAFKSEEVSQISQEEGQKVTAVVPNKLIFEKDNDNLTIKFIAENPEKLRGIKLNNDSDYELQCIDKNKAKECNISKSHFTQNGNYYTYYINSFNVFVILYEVEKVNIIIKNDDNNSDDKKDGDEPEKKNENFVGIIVGCVIGGLFLIVIIMFIIFRYRRKSALEDFSKDAQLLSNTTQVELNNA